MGHLENLEPNRCSLVSFPMPINNCFGLFLAKSSSLAGRLKYVQQCLPGQHPVSISSIPIFLVNPFEVCHRRKLSNSESNPLRLQHDLCSVLAMLHLHLVGLSSILSHCGSCRFSARFSRTHRGQGSSCSKHRRCFVAATTAACRSSTISPW